MPEFLKKGGQKLAQYCDQEDTAHRHAQVSCQPDIAPADGEIEMQPCPEACDHKQKVRKKGVPGAQGPQKAVEDPQGGAERQGCQQPPEGNRRGIHGSSRRQKPAGRGGAY